jgi:hypothetical protein
MQFCALSERADAGCGHPGQKDLPGAKLVWWGIAVAARERCVCFSDEHPEGGGGDPLRATHGNNAEPRLRTFVADVDAKT